MKNPIAIITGGSQGIGYSIADKFCEINYLPILIARDESKLHQAAKSLEEKYALSHEIPVYALDVTDKNAVNKTVAEISNQFSKVEVLVNCAGLVIRGASAISHANFVKQLEVNLIGAFNLIHATVPIMKKFQAGYIFNIASRSGKQAQAHWGAYAASKFGLVGFGEALHKELANKGIKVTTLCPGAVATEMSTGEEMPQQKMIQPKDIADLIACLLTLSSNALIKDIVIECTGVVIHNTEHEPR